MRQNTAYTSTEVSKVVTKPFYLMEIAFNTPLLLSSRDTVVVGGDTYQENGFKLSSIKKSSGSKISGKVIIANHDLIIGAIVLNQSVKNRAFTLYKAYGDGPFVAADLTLLIDGVLDAAPDIGKNVTLTFIAGDVHTNYAPRLSCSPPTFNHCIAPNVKIEWNDIVYELRPPVEVRIPE